MDRIDQPQIIRTKKGRAVEKQDIILVNHDHSVAVSCWGDKCTVIKSLISNKNTDHSPSILHITDLSVQLFAGKIRCNTTFNSVLTTNPTGFTLEMLLGSRGSSNSPSMTQSSSFVDRTPQTFHSGAMPVPTMKTHLSESSLNDPPLSSSQLTTLSGIQEHLAPLYASRPVAGAVIALLKDIDLDSPFYVRCPKCKRALSQQSLPPPSQSSDISDLPEFGMCPTCGTEGELQFKVRAVLIDATATLSVNLFGETAATFIGYTPAQLFLFDSDKRYEIRRKLFWKRLYVDFTLYQKESQRNLTVSVKSLSAAPTTMQL